MFLIVLCFSFASAQETKKENMTDYFQTGLQKTEMRKLDALIGKWAGDGWIVQARRVRNLRERKMSNVKLTVWHCLSKADLPTKKIPRK